MFLIKNERMEFGIEIIENILNFLYYLLMLIGTFMTEKLKIYGNQRVQGVVPISGAKNSALPLLAASLLSEDGLILENVPPLVDVFTMLSLLEDMGVSYEIKNKNSYSMTVELKTDSITCYKAPYDIVKKMRASILVLGPVLSRFGECSVSSPGGCAIGVRPIDLHLKGLEALGAHIELENGYVVASAQGGLKAQEFEFPIVTVTGTENLIMAAVLARGVTVLKNIAIEPEIIDLINCLNSMGAKIKINELKRIAEITGVATLHKTVHNVISDRIEAGTYAIAAAITKGEVTLQGKNIRQYLIDFLDILKEIGAEIEASVNFIKVSMTTTPVPIKISTAPYPGYPTDLQAQIMALLTLANGVSLIIENIWENRFMHVAELMRMGAKIELFGSSAKITGVKFLMGAPVIATDLRASFSLVLAGLAAQGDTILDRVYHLDRGYAAVKEKLAMCGVKVERFK